MKHFQTRIISLICIALLLPVLPVAAADPWTDDAGLEGLSRIELMRRLSVANIDMNTRDRSGDTPLYRIDGERFVSEEDVAALLHVLTIRRALRQTVGFGGGPPPAAEAARDFLIRELLLTAEARELGYSDLEKDVRFYIQEGWLQPEPPTPDASDTEALVRQGLMRAWLWRFGLPSAQDTQLPFKDSVPLIDALVAKLYEQQAASFGAPDTPVARSETADDLLIEQIDAYLAMSREEIVEKLGPDYTVEPIGPEGALDGYCYEDLGMAFAFYFDSDTPDFIDCYPNFRIRGVGIGSLFSEVFEALGEAEIIETWLADPDDKAFMVQYELGNAVYDFVAFEADGPVYILRIG